METQVEELESISVTKPEKEDKELLSKATYVDFFPNEVEKLESKPNKTLGTSNYEEQTEYTPFTIKDEIGQENTIAEASIGTNHGESFSVSPPILKASTNDSSNTPEDYEATKIRDQTEVYETETPEPEIIRDQQVKIVVSKEASDEQQGITEVKREESQKDETEHVVQDEIVMEHYASKIREEITSVSSSDEKLYSEDTQGIISSNSSKDGEMESGKIEDINKQNEMLQNGDTDVPISKNNRIEKEANEDDGTVTPLIEVNSSQEAELEQGGRIAQNSGIEVKKVWLNDEENEGPNVNDANENTVKQGAKKDIFEDQLIKSDSEETVGYLQEGTAQEPSISIEGPAEFKVQLIDQDNTANFGPSAVEESEKGDLKEEEIESYIEANKTIKEIEEQERGESANNGSLPSAVTGGKIAIENLEEDGTDELKPTEEVRSLEMESIHDIDTEYDIEGTIAHMKGDVELDKHCNTQVSGSLSEEILQKENNEDLIVSSSMTQVTQVPQKETEDENLDKEEPEVTETSLPYILEPTLEGTSALSITESQPGTTDVIETIDRSTGTTEASNINVESLVAAETTEEKLEKEENEPMDPLIDTIVETRDIHINNVNIQENPESVEPLELKSSTMLVAEEKSKEIDLEINQTRTDEDIDNVEQEVFLASDTASEYCGEISQKGPNESVEVESKSEAEPQINRAEYTTDAINNVSLTEEVLGETKKAEEIEYINEQIAVEERGTSELHMISSSDQEPNKVPSSDLVATENHEAEGIIEDTGIENLQEIEALSIAKAPEEEITEQVMTTEASSDGTGDKDLVFHNAQQDSFVISELTSPEHAEEINSETLVVENSTLDEAEELKISGTEPSMEITETAKLHDIQSEPEGSLKASEVEIIEGIEKPVTFTISEFAQTEANTREHNSEEAEDNHKEEAETEAVTVMTTETSSDGTGDKDLVFHNAQQDSFFVSDLTSPEHAEINSDTVVVENSASDEVEELKNADVKHIIDTETVELQEPEVNNVKPQYSSEVSELASTQHADVNEETKVVEELATDETEVEPSSYGQIAHHLHENEKISTVKSSDTNAFKEETSEALESKSEADYQVVKADAEGDKVLFPHSQVNSNLPQEVPNMELQEIEKVDESASDSQSPEVLFKTEETEIEKEQMEIAATESRENENLEENLINEADTTHNDISSEKSTNVETHEEPISAMLSEVEELINGTPIDPNKVKADDNSINFEDNQVYTEVKITEETSNDRSIEIINEVAIENQINHSKDCVETEKNDILSEEIEAVTTESEESKKIDDISGEFIGKDSCVTELQTTSASEETNKIADSDPATVEKLESEVLSLETSVEELETTEEHNLESEAFPITETSEKEITQDTEEPVNITSSSLELSVEEIGEEIKETATINENIDTQPVALRSETSLGEVQETEKLLKGSIAENQTEKADESNHTIEDTLSSEKIENVTTENGESEKTEDINDEFVEETSCVRELQTTSALEETNEIADSDAVTDERLQSKVLSLETGVEELKTTEEIPITETSEKEMTQGTEEPVNITSSLLELSVEEIGEETNETAIIDEKIDTQPVALLSDTSLEEVQETEKLIKGSITENQTEKADEANSITEDTLSSEQVNTENGESKNTEDIKDEFVEEDSSVRELQTTSALEETNEIADSDPETVERLQSEVLSLETGVEKFKTTEEHDLGSEAFPITEASEKEMTQGTEKPDNITSSLLELSVEEIGEETKKKAIINENIDTQPVAFLSETRLEEVQEAEKLIQDSITENQTERPDEENSITEDTLSSEKIEKVTTENGESKKTEDINDEFVEEDSSVRELQTTSELKVTNEIVDLDSVTDERFQSKVLSLEPGVEELKTTEAHNLLSEVFPIAETSEKEITQGTEKPVNITSSLLELSVEENGEEIKEAATINENTDTQPVAFLSETRLEEVQEADKLIKEVEIEEVTAEKPNANEVEIEEIITSDTALASIGQDPPDVFETEKNHEKRKPVSESIAEEKEVAEDLISSTSVSVEEGVDAQEKVEEQIAGSERSFVDSSQVSFAEGTVSEKNLPKEINMDEIVNTPSEVELEAKGEEAESLETSTELIVITEENYDSAPQELVNTYEDVAKDQIHEPLPDANSKAEDSKDQNLEYTVEKIIGQDFQEEQCTKNEEVGYKLEEEKNDTQGMNETKNDVVLMKEVSWEAVGENQEVEKIVNIKEEIDVDKGSDIINNPIANETQVKESKEYDIGDVQRNGDITAGVNIGVDELEERVPETELMYQANESVVEGGKIPDVTHLATNLTEKSLESSSSEMKPREQDSETTTTINKVDDESEKKDGNFVTELENTLSSNNPNENPKEVTEIVELYPNTSTMASMDEEKQIQVENEETRIRAKEVSSDKASFDKEVAEDSLLVSADEETISGGSLKNKSETLDCPGEIKDHKYEAATIRDPAEEVGKIENIVSVEDRTISEILSEEIKNKNHVKEAPTELSLQERGNDMGRGDGNTKDETVIEESNITDRELIMHDKDQAGSIEKNNVSTNNEVQSTNFEVSAIAGAVSDVEVFANASDDKDKVEPYVARTDVVNEESKPTDKREDHLPDKAHTDEEEGAQTDEEKEESKYDENQREDSGSDAPVMVEVAREADVKVHKKSHGIFSGVGSKVKHSISKVKKVITGKSSHPKPSSPNKETH